MNIGIFHSSLPGYSETFILSKIKALQSKGHNVVVFLANEAKDRLDLNIVNPYPRKGWLFWLYLIPVFVELFLFHNSCLIRFWRRERADRLTFIACLKSAYVNAHILRKKVDWLHFTFATFSLGRENVAAAIGANLAVSIRGFDIAMYPLKRPGCFLKLWNRVDKVHTISDDLYQLALLQGLSQKVSMQKIRPAIQVDNLRIKENLGDIKNVVDIISVGRLEWKKGFAYALEAMRLLKDSGYRFNYSIIGAGAMEEELRFAVHDLELRYEVKFIGKMSHGEVLDLLPRADIYLQPSVQEGFCNSLLEAQGSGLLCVCTDAEGLRENVIDSETGWVVPKRNSKAIADAIIRIISLPGEERGRISRQAIDRVQREFHLSRLLNEFEEFYSSA